VILTSHVLQCQFLKEVVVGLGAAVLVLETVAEDMELAGVGELDHYEMIMSKNNEF
jgi:hypothetical protein